MSQAAYFIQVGDIVLLAAGTAAIVAMAVTLSVRGRWAEAAGLPDPPAHRLEPIDLLIAAAALMFLPGLFLEGYNFLTGTTAATQPAEDALPTPQGVLASVAGQMIAIVVILILGRRRFAGGLSGWGLRAARWPMQLLTAVAAYVVICPICAGLFELTMRGIYLVAPKYQPPEHNAIRLLQSADVPHWLLDLTIASALILAPIVEELFFRGLLQPLLAKQLRSSWTAVLLCGCAFGLFHFGVGQTVPALAFFGVVLGYAYAKTGSLTLVILLHAVFNGKTLLWLMLSR